MRQFGNKYASIKNQDAIIAELRLNTRWQKYSQSALIIIDAIE